MKTDEEKRAEQRRRLGEHLAGHVAAAVDGAEPVTDAVLCLAPDAQGIVPPHLRGAAGYLTRVPAWQVVGFLNHNNLGAAADAVDETPPVGCNWVAHVSREGGHLCAIVAPWPRTRRTS